MQRPTTVPMSDPLEGHPLFTPDEEYATPPTTASLDNTHPYCPQTLTTYNRRRHEVLPVFPPASPLDACTTSESCPPLLLCNVPPQALSALQLARRAPHAYLPSFELSEHTLGMIDHQNDSFLASIYRQCLSDLSQKWKISIPLLDYNLARLYQCARQCLALWQQQQRQENLQLTAHPPLTATFAIEELPLALEFYLQIDVDLFYLKTCAFRGATPVEENIFCSKTPDIRYSISACQERSCHSCRPWHIRRDTEFDRAVPYDLRRAHQFVNGYRAILNCPASCTTANIIYALTCPCGKFDYIGATTQHFHECLAVHRSESNRVIREFLFGLFTTNRLRQGRKPEADRQNDRQWVYQHIARCPAAIQVFLDANPQYWCLVPMSQREADSRLDATAPPLHRARARPRWLDETIEPDAKNLVDGLPEPPMSYVFTERQRYDQLRFFEQPREEFISPPMDLNVDLYDATIIVVLPDRCSDLLRQLILSLLITHADCHLNKTGRLVNESSYRPQPVRGQWCASLVRRPPPIGN